MSRTKRAPDDDQEKLLITVDEAAHRLSIGRSHIYEQLQRGHLRSVRIGRSRRILLADLEAFLEALTTGVPPSDSVMKRAVKTHFPRSSGRR